MTDATAPAPPAPKKLLEEARLCLAHVDRLGDLSDEDRIRVYAMGRKIGDEQRTYLIAAQTYALVSIAENLERITRFGLPVP